ncbi:anhydro-N-acetylmuramic acid kinase [Synechococcus elongatus]|uniref:Anhydro-N-acetylmuramic acid kinase n=1 Tax=Synechococcus elongatus PCC 11801 TaxID=2219813 RepID=A0AAN1QN95_SYNEL|nr:anhydro-N-acetylmuramic acid kinase [Synechococcus elongatus]AZB72424.1 anhydro-N-acetylmuramic acid kinase [Synechococcus elongatus PCC 11801]
MRVLGLISGTSADGIDAAIAEIRGQQADLQVNLIAFETIAYDPALRDRILEVAAGFPLSVAELTALDATIAQSFARAAQTLIARSGSVDLIGSHGQTIYHQPPQAGQLGWSVQLGWGAAIAQQTGIPTISNFRSADLAVGGQGAPLVPAVDLWLLGSDSENRCVQNIGGIGNLTWLPRRDRPDWQTEVRGWDTGPGNSLLDLAVQKLSQGRLSYDAGGQWAATGQIDQALCDRWLQEDDYFRLPPPKSTGRERYGWQFLETWAAELDRLSAADQLATLTEFTAVSIADNYRRFLPALPDRVLLCGGGLHNQFLVQRLQQHLPTVAIASTDEFGVNSQAKEAISIAVLAYWRQHNRQGNLPAVTGAKRAALLGDVFIP